MGYFDTAIKEKDNTLSHHGIFGQKWGIRRFQNKNGSLKPAGKSRYKETDNAKKSSNTTESTSTTESKKGLSDKQKKALKIGAAAVGTALAAYGGYKLYQVNKKATEGISKDYHNAAVTARVVANKMKQKSYESSYDGDLTKSKEYFNRSETAKDFGKMFDEKSVDRKYPISQKVGYLANEQKKKAVAKYVEKNIKAFNNAALANDELVKELLKKNASMLANF